MPAAVADHAAPVEGLTEAPFELPTEEQVSDAQASAQLSVLFHSYQELKSKTPRLPNEKVIVPMLHFRPGEVDALIDDAIGKYRTWLDRLNDVTLTINEIGETNPGASLAIIGKSGRVVQANGLRLFEAIMRTDAEILGGSVRN